MNEQEVIISALRLELESVTTELLKHWKDPFKAPELKRSLGQEAIYAYASALSNYAEKLGFAP